MRVIDVSVLGPKRSVEEAVAVLRAGGTVAHATETCYGLACDLTNADAVRKLFVAKNRSFEQPVSALFPTVAAAEAYVRFSTEALALAEARLPGPTTLILPVRSDAAHTFFVTANGEPATSAGVRVSSHPLACLLAQTYSLPLSTTSANRHGLPPAYDVSALREQWLEYAETAPDLCLDEGTLPLRPPSVIIDCTDGNRILR